jgi:hypothetical protein
MMAASLCDDEGRDERKPSLGINSELETNESDHPDEKEDLEDEINLSPLKFKKLTVEEIYGEDIDNHHKDLELKRPISSILKDNAITRDHRAVMIDWMIEVMTTFKCADQSLFIAASLMDRYFNVVKGLKLRDLHIIGVSAMFSASKYNDVNYLLMKTVFNKIGHKLIKEEAIRE